MYHRLECKEALVQLDFKKKEALMQLDLMI